MNAPVNQNDLLAMIAELKKANEALATQNAALAIKAATPAKHTLKVGQSGTVCLYHGAKYPIAKYASEWAHIIPFIKSGAIERFIETNADLLAKGKA